MTVYSVILFLVLSADYSTLLFLDYRLDFLMLSNSLFCILSSLFIRETDDFWILLLLWRLFVDSV